MMGNAIAAIAGAEGAVIEELLERAATDWRASGLKVCGALAESDRIADRTCSAGFLRNIETGARFAMYLKDPPAHTSCHLDENGIVDACASLSNQIAASDVVVLSKFGKVEAVGSGLFEAFVSAIAQGKPILTSVAPKHLYAWQRFAPDAVFIRPERALLEQWLSGVLHCSPQSSSIQAVAHS
ncbi:hypothetical protein ASD64_08630 [Mesorhizobium sp. Root157]|uniref:DUF2478 domain-containing protein n=1 Tax=Mesorhizobium sp. Root157 TaxID=1736477 RepID=UPI0006FE9D60|nr:DUF2478 domain-containing protein [Mesorhizobium sp. Root157]KQZ81818.1 hypothetical protein ASD64_08630 [Mesorhizobium sp. Root157]